MISTRRRFLGTAFVSGVPLIFDNVALAAPSKPQLPDHVLDHIGRELAATFGACKATGTIRGEDLRTVASNLRLLSRHGTVSNIWAPVEKRFASSIAEKGVAAFSATSLSQASIESLRRQIARTGMTVTTQELEGAFAGSDLAGREQAVTRLRKRGLERGLADVAASLDVLARNADLNSGPGVVLVRSARHQLSQACQELATQMYILEAFLIAVAVAAPYAAVELAMALLFLRMYYSLMGC